MAKTYILQKDLPNAKAGMEYELTDNGLDYICYNLLGHASWDVSYPKEYIENNPQWFRLKEENSNMYEAAHARAIELLPKLKSGFQ